MVRAQYSLVMAFDQKRRLYNRPGPLSGLWCQPFSSQPRSAETSAIKRTIKLFFPETGTSWEYVPNCCRQQKNSITAFDLTGETTTTTVINEFQVLVDHQVKTLSFYGHGIESHASYLANTRIARLDIIH